MFRFRMVSLVLMGLLALPIYSQQSKKKQTPPKPTAPASAKKPDFPLDSLTQFSATMVGGLMGNIDELKIYRSGNLMRTEMLDEKNYMLTNLDTNDTFVVLPDRCAHDARPSVNTFPFSLVRAGQKVDRNSLGTERLDGHTCQVEEITITPQHGTPMKLKMWEATDLSGFPLKLEVQRTTGTPVTITYKEVKIERPDASLFQLPARCPAPAKKKRGSG